MDTGQPTKLRAKDNHLKCMCVIQQIYGFMALCIGLCACVYGNDFRQSLTHKMGNYHMPILILAFK